MSKMLDLTGQKFGRLTALTPVRGKTNIRWQCICECGNTTIVGSYDLHTNKIKSCGCWRIEFAKNRTGPRKANAVSRDPLYRLFLGMHSRCRNPNLRAFKYYGGRGIKVCARWASFENFKADMGPRPDGFSIDRIDKDGNYEPANCRWADHYTQANNRNANIPYTFDGETMNLYAWAMRKGLSADTLYHRWHQGDRGDYLFREPNSVLSEAVRKSLTKACEKSLAVRRARTHCKQGHPYEGDNLFFEGMVRRCRICHNAKVKRYALSRRQRRAH